MGSQEEELRTLVIEVNGASGVIGEDGRHGEGSVPSSEVHMILSSGGLESRIPMHEAFPELRWRCG